MKRLATGEPVTKQVRVDIDGDTVLTNPQAQPVRLAPSVTRRRPILTPQNISMPKNKKTRKTKGSKKSMVQALGKREEKYDLMNNLAQASEGITFGQIKRGDIEKILKDLQKFLSEKVSSSSLNVAGEA